VIFVRLSFAAVIGFSAIDLHAQAQLAGFVRDSAGRPVSGAEVSIPALNKTVNADDSGRYSLDGVTAGMRLVQVRRVGFVSVTRMVRVKLPETATDFVLRALAVELDTVRRTEQYKPTDIMMMEFLDNKRIGLGKFFTRDDLEKMNDRPLAEAFYQMTPGITILTGTSGGSKAWLVSTIVRSLNPKIVELEGLACIVADTKNPLHCKAYEQTSPYKEAWQTRCFPDVFLDFDLLSRHEVPNINRFSTAQLEAVEVYRSPAELPARYIGATSQCGVVVFHRRRVK
jgi:hypothetical protein